MPHGRESGGRSHGVISTAPATRRIVTASAPSFSRMASAAVAIFSAVLSVFIYTVYTIHCIVARHALWKSPVVVANLQRH